LKPLFGLTMRQLYSRKRVIVIYLLALVPVVLTAIDIATSSERSTFGFAVFVLDGMVISAILPVVVLTLATTCFGTEIDDKTLSHVALTPLRPWQIVLPKFLVCCVLAGIPILLAGLVSAYFGLDGDLAAVGLVALALAGAVVAYSAVFVWAGLISTRALGFGLVYVLLWEGVMTSFLGGIRYLSIHAYALGILNWTGADVFRGVADRAVELPAAAAGIVLVTAIFLFLTIRRLRNMDIP